MNDIQFPYRPSAWMMLLAALFFGGCAWDMANEALTNQQGLILNGIHLSPDETNIFYWTMTAVSGAFVLAAMPALFIALFSKHRLTLNATEISAPRHGFSRKNTVVPLREIRHVDIQTVQKERFLNIHHSGGKLTITQSFLPNAQAFEGVHQAIVARMYEENQKG